LSGPGTLEVLGPLFSLLRSLSLLDYIGLITLGVFALDGVRRGFVLGVLDVVVLALTLTAAVTLYPLVAGLLVEQVNLPGALTNVAAFAAIFLVGQLLYRLAASILDALLRPMFAALPPLRALDGLAGAVPGFVKGAVVVAILASAVRSLPMAAEIRAPFEASQVVARAAPIGSRIVPDLPALLGRLGLDQIVIAPPPQQSAPQHEQTVSFPPNVRTDVDLASEARMLELVNQERTANGLVALTMDDRVREVARSHSLEMFQRSYFAHESPVTGSPFDRMSRAGIRFNLAGENLAYAPNVETAHRGLMNSPEHRRNILLPGFRKIGIGVIQAGSWGRMFTQNFTD
jgi:uncharacterized protein YkwD/uncharacterized membrane protein required for colicin V production